MWINGSLSPAVSGGDCMFTLEAVDVYRFYHTEEEETLALRGVTFNVSAGEVISLMGPSGSGKSTLLACLSGIDEPDGGYVKIFGKRITRRSELVRAAFRASETGIVLQAGNLVNHLTVEDNIRLKMWLTHRVDNRRIVELLDKVGLSDRRYSYPSQISGGEAARAAVAVALSTNPKILFADEPTGEVDEQTEERIISLFRDYGNNGGTAIIATHSKGLAAHTDRVIHLLDGRVIDEF
jgi:putative ABC transport system ATP-binding protein